MAEAIAVICVVASVAQLADYGFKLSVKLFTFSEAVYSADRSIRNMSNDVSLTSTVLKELSEILKADTSNHVSDRAIGAAQQTVTECLAIFEELDKALEKSLGNLGALDRDGKKKVKGVATLERLKWPFKQTKMDVLRSNLDRLKASLTLMLQVLSYARELSARKANEQTLQQQKALIERLAHSEKLTQRRYQLALRMDTQESVASTSDPPPQYHSLSPTLNATSTTLAAGPSTNRDLGNISSPRQFEALAPISVIPPPPPAANPHVDSLAHQLLLCLKLLEQLLDNHLAEPLLGVLAYLRFRQALIDSENMQRGVKSLGKHVPAAYEKLVEQLDVLARAHMASVLKPDIMDIDSFGEQRLADFALIQAPMNEQGMTGSPKQPDVQKIKNRSVRVSDGNLFQDTCLSSYITQSSYDSWSAEGQSRYRGDAGMEAPLFGPHTELIGALNQDYEPLSSPGLYPTAGSIAPINNVGLVSVSGKSTSRVMAQHPSPQLRQDVRSPYFEVPRTGVETFTFSGATTSAYTTPLTSPALTTQAQAPPLYSRAEEPSSTKFNFNVPFDYHSGPLTFSTPADSLAGHDKDAVKLSRFQKELLQRRHQELKSDKDASSSVHWANKGHQMVSGGNHALQDYQVQMMLLEQQNKKRLLMARQAQEAMAQSNPGFSASTQAATETIREQMNTLRPEAADESEAVVPLNSMTSGRSLAAPTGFKQQTGIPSGSMASPRALSESTSQGFSGTSNTNPSDNFDTFEDMNFAMHFNEMDQFGSSAALPEIFFPPGEGSQADDFVDPTNITKQEEAQANIHPYPGMDQQQVAIAKAQAQAQQQRQQQLIQQQQKQRGAKQTPMAVSHADQRQQAHYPLSISSPLGSAISPSDVFGQNPPTSYTLSPGLGHPSLGTPITTPSLGSGYDPHRTDYFSHVEADTAAMDRELSPGSKRKRGRPASRAMNMVMMETAGEEDVPGMSHSGRHSVSSIGQESGSAGDGKAPPRALTLREAAPVVAMWSKIKNLKKPRPSQKTTSGKALSGGTNLLQAAQKSVSPAPVRMLSISRRYSLISPTDSRKQSLPQSYGPEESLVTSPLSTYMKDPESPAQKLPSLQHGSRPSSPQTQLPSVAALIKIADQGVPMSPPSAKQICRTPRQIPLFSNVAGYGHTANYDEQAGYDIKRAPSNPEKRQRLGGQLSSSMFSSGGLSEIDDELMRDYSEDGDVVDQLLARWTTLRPSSDDQHRLNPREDEKLASMQNIPSPEVLLFKTQSAKVEQTLSFEPPLARLSPLDGREFFP